jgi:hypothetical protein
MATVTYDTLNHLVMFNDKNIEQLGITNLLDSAPLLQVLASKEASQKTVHKFSLQTRKAEAKFRAMNAGVSLTKSQDTDSTVLLKILDGSFDVDVAYANQFPGGVEAALRLEFARAVREMFFMAEKQVLNGTTAQGGGDAAGFSGLMNDTRFDTLSDSMVIQPSTAGASVNSQTSVWLLRHDPDNVCFLLGDGGKFIYDEDPAVGWIYDTNDPTATKYPGYIVPVSGWAGLQVGSDYSAARIANVETALTDDDIYEALSLFPSDRQANVIVMNRKALKLLRQSRTAVNQTGAPAPRPTEVDGIPIVVTDALQNNQGVVSA